jgi:hypothetical protein
MRSGSSLELGLPDNRCGVPVAAARPAKAENEYSAAESGTAVAEHLLVHISGWVRFRAGTAR